MAKTKAEIQKEYSKRTNYASQNKYHKEKTKSIVIRFMLNSEMDLIEHLENQPNKAGYIKSLIRNDMKNKD